jgi:dUTP pyrophosphatase
MLLNKIEVPIKRLRDDAVIPRYQTEGAAGFDFHAVIDDTIVIEPGEWKEVSFGIALEIPPGYELRVRSRSGPAFNHHVIAYHGLIDSDYRGELSVLLHNTGAERYTIKPGDRVAQGVLSRYDTAVFVEVSELSETARGTGGFGSTGLS